MSLICKDVSHPCRYPVWNHAPPSKLQDFVMYSMCHPISKYVICHRFSSSHASFLSAIYSVHEPKTSMKQIIKILGKSLCMKSFKLWHKLKLGLFLNFPMEKKTIGSRWVYKTKFNSNGTINRHKSQILAQGFTQTLGV